MSKRDSTPDPLYESLAQMRRAERAIAKRNDMPGNLEDYRVAYTEFHTCAFDNEIISDPDRMVIAPDGRYYHNSDCSSAMSQIDDFYETMPTMTDPLDAELEKIETDKIRRARPVNLSLTHDELDLLCEALVTYRAQLNIEARSNPEPPAQERDQAEALHIKLLVEGKS